jgi:hypothetical protein
MTRRHLFVLIRSRLQEEITYLRQRADDQTRAPTDTDFNDDNTATTGEHVTLPDSIADQPAV